MVGRELPLGAVLRAAVIGGLAAGLAAAIFHLAATERLIDQAIALEEELRAAEATGEMPLVSREAQRIGLVAGSALYGLTWGLLLGVLYHVAQRWLPAWGAFQRGVLLAAVGCWALSLLPFLKYPANPPGVGDPATIVYRQGLYLGLLGLSIAGTAAAWALGASARRCANLVFTTLARRLGRSAYWLSLEQDGRRWPWALALLAGFDLVVYLVMPGNPDSIGMPAEVVSSFRALSLMGLVLFWAVLGITFGWLLSRPPTRPTEELGGSAPQRPPGGAGQLPRP